MAILVRPPRYSLRGTAMKANSTGRVFPATDGLRRATGLRTRTASLERAVAYFIVVASQIPIGSSQFLRLSLVEIVQLLPAFLTECVRGAKEIRILLLVFLCIVSGLLLALKNVDQSRSWDSWSALFGLAGILLATTALGHLARASLALNTQILRQMGLPVGAMAVLLTGAIWDILFSPANSWTLAVALLVSLQVMRHDLAADGIDPHKRDSSE